MVALRISVIQRRDAMYRVPTLTTIAMLRMPMRRCYRARRIALGATSAYSPP